MVYARFPNNGLELIAKAHQLYMEGYGFMHDNELVTIFSAPNYCGEFDNAASIMSVDDSLMCSFQILKPAEKRQRYVFSGEQGKKGGKK